MPVNETTLASPVFDQLRQAMACDPAGFTELYRDYLADVWQTLDALRDAVQQRQAGELSFRAHQLKGCSMVLGARRVAQCAAALEEAGKSGGLLEAGTLVAQTELALREVEAELAGRLGAGVIPADKTGAA